MLIMAEVTAEMGAELRAAALASHTSVAGEVGRRLERLARLEAEDRRVEATLETIQSVSRREFESLYSDRPNPSDMFRSTGRGR
jgi:hypothetical protein